MKNPNKTNLVICSIVALALSLVLVTRSQVLAKSAEPAEDKDQMMKSCKEMMEHKKQMKAEMKAMDDELASRVAQMNSAPKDKKLDLAASVITLMAEQRMARDEKMAKMDEEKMKHMMHHNQMGPDSESKCPMMKCGDQEDEKWRSDDK